MPRGNPRKPVNLRLDPSLMDAVRKLTDNFNAAVEDALRLWLKKEERRRRAVGQKEPAAKEK